jgi:hypothetical protein
VPRGPVDRVDDFTARTIFLVAVFALALFFFKAVCTFFAIVAFFVKARAVFDFLSVKITFTRTPPRRFSKRYQT